MDLRDKLQQKVQEVGDLIGDLGRIPEKMARKGRRKSRLAHVGERMSSATEQEWRNRLSMREAVAEERADSVDGRLPAIHEDKLYPRRTLENAEMSALREEAALQQASESPELGPPPVAHFDVGADSVGGFDSARTSEDENGSEDVIALPSVLERRRKRRTSALLQTIPAEDNPEEMLPEAAPERPLPTARPAQQLLKSGAKRKLDVSELEEPVRQQQSGENDDFVFQRRQENPSNAAIGTKKASRFTKAPGRENSTGAEESQSPQKVSIAARKILAPKSTNSPTKRRVQISEKLKDEREEQPKQTTVKLSRRSNPPPQLHMENVAPSVNEEDGQEKNIPPKTPAAGDDGILSPMSTEPSARDTKPKEAALLNSVEDVLNGSIGRGSRRARPAISYAEPNLRDKMRRPGKELVGAVEGLHKENSSSTRGPGADRARSEDVKANEDQCRAINIKKEKDPRADERWRQLPMRKQEDPTSPLGDKEKKERVPTDLKKADGHNSTDSLEKAVDRLSIFDPPSSSPVEGSNHQHSKLEEHKAPSTRRKTSASGLTTRRHSVQPSPSLGSTTDGISPATALVRPKQRLSTSQNPLVRPNSAASLRSEQMANIARDIKRSNSVKDSAASVDEPNSGGSSRAERTLSRRRSMMV